MILNKILYRIKNVSFLFFLFGYITLIPNIEQAGIIGKLFLATGIVYTLFIYLCYIKKNDNLNNNFFQNILTIFLYIYVFIIACKYNNIIKYGYVLNMQYFKINYLIIIISVIAISFNNILLCDKNR